MRRHTRFAAASSCIAMAALIGLAMPRTARAQRSLVVDSTDDEPDADLGDRRCATARGRCTLRAAVQESNASPGADQIALPAGSYRLAIEGSDEDGAVSGDLDCTDDVRIEGEGDDRSSVDGAGIDAVFHVLPGVSVEMSRLSISGGVGRRDFNSAGGVVNQGTLRLRDVWLVSNVAAAPYGVGGLLNQGVATIEDSRVERNTPAAISSVGDLAIRRTVLRQNGFGVAVAMESGSLTMVDSEIADHLGTAMFCQGGPARIVRSRIHHTRPGAAMLIPSGDVLVLDSLIDSNAGGGINNDGSLQVVRSTLRANSPAGDAVVSGDVGGAAGIAGSTAYTGVTNSSGAVVIDSTVLDHRGGGLVNEQGSMQLVNVTVGGNASTVGAGGVTNFGSEIDIRNCTITDNRSTAAGAAGGFAAYADEANRATVANTVIAGNHAEAGAPDCVGPITSQGHNLIGDTAGCGDFATAAGDLLSVPPGLGPLADNGGPTLTHAPLDGSPAIDAGSPLPIGDIPGACPRTDQRGAGRPQGGRCDIGAVEVAASCGDGALDSGETCDDGNRADGDCCSALCRIEPTAGDCDADGAVEIDDLLRAVAVALGERAVDDCAYADGDGDGRISIGELVAAVQAALSGCQPPAV